MRARAKKRGNGPALRSAKKPRRAALKRLLAKVNDRNAHPAVDTGPAVGREPW